MSDSTPDEPDGATPISHLLFRPIEVFNQLPVEYRWEFTRRHPYYLAFWRPVRESREQLSTDAAIRFAQQAASLILAAINVGPSVLPPDPQDEFATLGMNTIGDGWEGGAVAPAMFRTMACTLLLALPKAERAQLGRLLNESAEYDSRDATKMAPIFQQLAALPGEVWKRFPDVPLISINLQASQRAITEAVETLVRRWKLERAITETRRRDDKLEEYLAVWDLREGWSEGRYDGAQEKQFHEIAAQLRLAMPTVVNRYRTAFQYLTGHDYRPELWIRLFGPGKLSRESNPDGDSRVARYRPWRTRNLRAVAESVLLPGRSEGDNPQFLAGAGITESDLGYVELQLDVQTLIERGDSNEKSGRNSIPTANYPKDSWPT